jgi:hypothetical protein
MGGGVSHLTRKARTEFTWVGVKLLLYPRYALFERPVASFVTPSTYLSFTCPDSPAPPPRFLRFSDQFIEGYSKPF